MVETKVEPLFELFDGEIPSLSSRGTSKRVSRKGAVALPRRGFLARTAAASAVLGLYTTGLAGFTKKAGAADPNGPFSCNNGWANIWSSQTAWFSPCRNTANVTWDYAVHTNCTGCGPSSPSSSYCKPGHWFYKNHKNCADWHGPNNKFRYYDRPGVCVSAHSSNYDGWYWDTGSSNGCGCGPPHSGAKARFRCPDGWFSSNYGNNWTKTICRTKRCL